MIIIVLCTALNMKDPFMRGELGQVLLCGEGQFLPSPLTQLLFPRRQASSDCMFPPFWRSREVVSFAHQMQIVMVAFDLGGR